MAVKLPERNYFTFQELMERWGCEEGDLFHLISERKLIPSYFFFLENATDHFWEKDFNGLLENVNVEVGSDMMTPHGFYYLIHPFQHNAFDVEFSKISRDRQSKAVDGQHFLKLDDTRISFQELLKNGVVMLSEVALFEGNAETPEALEVDDKPLSPRERDTLLTIIGVLLELVQSPMAGRDSEAAVIKEMLQNYDERPGIKKRTLEQKFAEAKRVLGNR